MAVPHRRPERPAIIRRAAALLALSVLLPWATPAALGNGSPAQWPAGLAFVLDEPIAEASRGETVHIDGLVFNTRNETDFVQIYRDVGAGRRAAGVEVAIVAKGTMVGPASSLEFEVVAEIAPSAAPGALTEVALVAQSGLDPAVRALGWVTVVVEPSLEIRIDPDPLVRMADPGEEVEFDVSLELAAISQFRVPVTLEAVSHQAFVALGESEWSIGTGFGRSTQLRVRLPTHVTVGTELAVTLRASAAGFDAAAAVQVVVVVNTTHRLTMDVAPFPFAAPGDALEGTLSLRNEGLDSTMVDAPRMQSEPGGWTIGQFSPPAARQFVDARSGFQYTFAVSVGADASPIDHQLSICLCPLWGHAPSVPFSVPVRRVFDLSLTPIRDTAVAGPGAVAYFDFEIALAGNAGGEVRMELAGAPAGAPPRLRLLEAHGGLPPGTPWPFPRVMAPGDVFRLRLDVPLEVGIEPGDMTVLLSAQGPSHETASVFLRLVVGGPELVAASLAAPDPPPASGQVVELTVRVANVGLGTTKEFVVELTDNGQAVASATVPRLDAGEDRAVVLHWNAGPGEHVLTARVDPPSPQGPAWGVIPEANEEDNEVTVVVVVAAEAPFPVESVLALVGAAAAVAAVGVAHVRWRPKPPVADASDLPWVYE